MYWNIFDKGRYELLKKISEVVSINDYYMVGGTALSLQLGLRESYDFDFCVKNQFNNEILLDELKSIGNVEVIQNQKGTCDVLLNGVQVSFFYYPNKVRRNGKSKYCKYIRYCSNEISCNRRKRSKEGFFRFI